MLNKVLARLCLLGLSVVITIGVMIHGWGLEPKSWWWILGAGLGLHALVLVLHNVLDGEEKKK